MPDDPDRSKAPLEGRHRCAVGSVHPPRRASHIRFDNGPEFVATAVRNWIAAVGARTAYIEPGSPWESFNAKLRDELPDGEIFYSLAEAKIVIENWRCHYNAKRPHSSPGYRPPAPQVLQGPASPPGTASPATPTVAPRPVMH